MGYRGNVCQIASCVSTSGCNRASLEMDGRLLCESFTANVWEFEQHESDVTMKYLYDTEREVTVWHTFKDEDMISGERLVIGMTPDGLWITLVWPCPV